MSGLADVKALLVEARHRGYLGDQPVPRQIEHSRGFAAVCVAVSSAWLGNGADPELAGAAGGETRLLLDLGAGGGIPGLVLGLSPMPSIDGIALLEGSARRADWLRHAVESLGLGPRVEVLGERAELVGRLPQWRHRCSIVVARAFGRPAVTAECAAPLLRVGGSLIVSEPPSPEEGSTCLDVIDGAVRGPSGDLERRWPSDGLAKLGFGPAVEWRACGFRYAAMRVREVCPERYPRRNGIPAKRPLF